MMSITGGGTHHMQIQIYGGWDAVLLPLLPRPLRLKMVARKIRRHHQLKDPPPGGFTFSLPGESLIYEVTDRGARPYRRP